MLVINISKIVKNEFDFEQKRKMLYSGVNYPSELPEHWSDEVTREDGEWMQLPFIKNLFLFKIYCFRGVIG